jgi:hypothetical protein
VCLLGGGSSCAEHVRQQVQDALQSMPAVTLLRNTANKWRPTALLSASCSGKRTTCMINKHMRRVALHGAAGYCQANTGAERPLTYMRSTC